MSVELVQPLYGEACIFSFRCYLACFRVEKHTILVMQTRQAQRFIVLLKPNHLYAKRLTSERSPVLLLMLLLLLLLLLLILMMMMMLVMMRVKDEGERPIMWHLKWGWLDISPCITDLCSLSPTIYFHALSSPGTLDLRIVGV
jgi:hypothetical protein